MATKKVVAKKKPVAKTEVLTIPAETVIAGLKRFGTVCDFVEEEMRRRSGKLISGDDATGNRMFELSPSMPLEAQCVTPSNGLSQRINTSLDIAQELFQISDEILSRLRGGQPPSGANSAHEPSLGPMKDGVDTVNDRIRLTTANLRSIGEYIFA